MMWLVLLPVVWSRCETFTLCFAILHAINHGMVINKVLINVYKFILLPV